MVDGHPRRVFSRPDVLDPVYDVAAVVVIDRHDGPDAGGEILQAAFERVEFLGLQLRIRQVSAHGVIQFGKGGHPVGSVVGAVDAQGFGQPEIHFHARIEADTFLIARVVGGRDPGRGGKALQHDTVLDECREGRPGQSADVHAVGMGECLAEVGAPDGLVTGSCSEGAAAQAAIDAEMEVSAYRIGPVVVERIQLRLGSEELETVFPVVPIE